MNLPIKFKLFFGRETMIIDSLQYNGMCSCGKEHKMSTVFSIIESGCLKNLPEYMKKYGLTGKAAAIYDQNTYNATADRHPKVDFEIVLNPEKLHANEYAVDAVMSKLPKDIAVLIAIGAGTIHDITRYCAKQLNIDFISCPTAASVDGFCSSVAAMTWSGCKKTFSSVAPKLVIADLDIIKAAPVRCDMIGKYTSITDWKISNILTGEFYCERISDMTMQATKAVLESVEGIIKGDIKAYEKLTYGLLLSGLAMQMLGFSRPASAAEHHISHFIEMEPVGLAEHSEALHGEKVGVGTLIVIKEYQRLCAIKNPQFKDYEEYTVEYLQKMFDCDMIKGVLEENQNDCAKGVTADTFYKNWQAICDEVSKMPDADFLKELYLKYDIKSTLEDIEISNEKESILLDYSPCVRNRLTLMRMRKCFS